MKSKGQISQVTVLVLEEEDERTKEKKQDEEKDAFRGLQSDLLRSCDPEDLLGLRVAVGVLASLLGLVLIGGCVAGAVLYRR